MPLVTSGALIALLQVRSFGFAASESASALADPQRGGGPSSLSPLLRSSRIPGGRNPPAGRLLTGGGSATTTDWSQVSPLLASDPSLGSLLPSVPTAAYAQTLYDASASSPVDVNSVYTVTASADTVALCSGEEDHKPIVAGPSHVCTSNTCSGPGFEVGTEHCRTVINGPSVLLKGRLGTW
uniref:Uncharacterized protein n=1 Tax=Odontella aurita TaxID=265563 RepID=A0A7S4K4M8_9STRA|mmetsp:Transcript_61590/g.182016  ORF Transcript_61590/g.182016 Transcript_61590/m.182016 type:complete len:182 (+) Transcript_61590:432-977(+)